MKVGGCYLLPGQGGDDSLVLKFNEQVDMIKESIKLYTHYEALQRYTRKRFSLLLKVCFTTVEIGTWVELYVKK